MWDDFIKRYNSKKKCMLFYNNFEVVRVSLMTQPIVQKFCKAMTDEEPYGVFKWRWGDAIIRYLAIAIFVDESKIMNSKNNKVVGYKHGKYVVDGSLRKIKSKEINNK